MVNPYRFYTYAYLREDKTPYYVGKGSGKRIYSKEKNINLPKDKSRIIFLKQNITEEEAFRHEIYMIAFFDKDKEFYSMRTIGDRFFEDKDAWVVGKYGLEFLNEIFEIERIEEELK